MSSDPSVTYTLEKPVWTEADFEKMGWHDARIHAFAFQPELREFWVDLDYIFLWEQPTQERGSFRWWIAPVTLVFQNACNLQLELGTFYGGLSGLDIGREEPEFPRDVDDIKEWSWFLDCHEGVISLLATGYTQFTRRVPVLADSQWLTMEQRGGISFGREFSSTASS